MESIKKAVNGKKLWISIVETTDVEGRFIANVFIGTLSPMEAGRHFLINMEALEKVNHTTIARLFENSLKILGDVFDSENVLFFLTVAVPYMVKAGNALHVFHAKMIHVTCLTHGLNRIAETIRGHHIDVDMIISSTKKVFRKYAPRVQIFKEMAPGIPLPPKPVITRWDNFIEIIICVKYFASNILQIIRVKYNA